MKANPEYVKQARALRGKKAALIGGGMSAQYLYVVKVISVSRDGHATLKLKGWTYPGTKTETFKPLLMSWQVVPLAKGYGNLPMGKYDLLAGVRVSPKKPLVKIKKK